MAKGFLLQHQLRRRIKNTLVKIENREYFSFPHKENCLAISPTKNNSRIEWLLEKVTEIGIKEIVLLDCERTEKTNVKYERLHNILISAMLQSRQVYLPELRNLIKFDAIVKNNLYEEKYIAHCLHDENKIDLKTIRTNASQIILIGPEGDFTQNEINLALAENFKPVSLGHTRLRTETAGLAATILLNL